MTRSPDAQARRELQKLPNIGPRMADDLIRLGIRQLSDLESRDPDEMYAAICRLDNQRHDPCVWDTYAAVVDFAKTGKPRKWWEFTAIRKKRGPLQW